MKSCVGSVLATWLLLAVPVAAPAPEARAREPAPRVEYSGAARVVDGDTLVVTDARQVKHRVRLFGVDAPETKQTCTLNNGTAWACGVQAGDALRDHIGNASVHCVTVDTDRYGRDVGVCDAGPDEPLNSWLVSNGWALAYRQYGGKQFDADEAQAKKEKAGVWRGTLQTPWEWRQAQRRSGAG
jgi:endonuclease YncB( thermonuclease family)